MEYQFDFFINNLVFVEFHPPQNYDGKKIETVKSYYQGRRKILDENGYKNYPLIVIDRLQNLEHKINRIKELVTFKLD